MSNRAKGWCIGFAVFLGFWTPFIALFVRAVQGGN